MSYEHGNPDPNERYECVCGAVMAPEDLKARVVLPTLWDSGYTEYCCPWCGSSDLEHADEDEKLEIQSLLEEEEGKE